MFIDGKGKQDSITVSETLMDAYTTYHALNKQNNKVLIELSELSSSKKPKSIFKRFGKQVSIEIPNWLKEKFL